MKFEKKQSIKEAMKDINKKYGEPVIVDMDDLERARVESFSTNCFSLDRVFACGGIPKGRMIEIFGQESSGKSTLAMYLIAQVQKQGGTALFIDAEFAFNRDWAEKIGVNVEALKVAQPGTAEEALDIIDRMVARTNIDVIVLDSVASLVPQREYEGGVAKDTIALQAKMMSKALRIITGNVARSKAIVIFINQIREKVGVFFGKKDTTAGGKALKFYASVRLEVKKGKKIVDGKGEVIGNWLSVCAVKNKVGLPWRQCELELYYERGVDTIGDLIDSGTQAGLIKKAGGVYNFKGKKLGIGREQVKKLLIKDTEVAEELRKELLALFSNVN